MNTLLEAKEFVEKEIFACWQKWNPSAPVKEMWASAFKPYSYEDALACFQRYYSKEETKFKPSIRAVMAYMQWSNGKLDRCFYAQNIKNGIFHMFCYPDGIDVDAAMEKTFKRHFPDGNWKGYKESEITHDELFEYQRRKENGLRSAIEHVESEAEAANIIETYDVHPMSGSASLLKEAVKALKRLESEKIATEKIEKLKDENKIDDSQADFIKRNRLDDSDMHQTETVIDNDDLF